MKESAPKPNSDLQLLETERGMFVLEYRDRVIPQAEILINAASVTDEVKVKCKELIEEGLGRAQDDKIYRIEVYDLSHGTISQLLDYLGDKEPEQFELFKALRNCILSARNSAVGWRDQHLEN